MSHANTVIALHAFVETIEATGGITYDAKGAACPEGEPEWIDLGEAYLDACRALGREPKIVGMRCLDCGNVVSVIKDELLPAPDESAAWDDLGFEHRPDCNWITTRAYQIGEEV